MSLPKLISPLLITLISLTFITCSSSASDPAIEIINPKVLPPPKSLPTSNKLGEFERSSDYRMVSSSPINVYIIWYGRWASRQQLIIKDFLHSFSPSESDSLSSSSKTESDWWKTVSLYTDHTGANVSRSLIVAGEYSDQIYSHGTNLSLLTVEQVVVNAFRSAPFRVDHNHNNGVYLVLTSKNVILEDFCLGIVCGRGLKRFSGLNSIPSNGGLL